jgi:hypothetical protein
MAVAMTATFCPAAPGVSVIAEGDMEREKSGWSCNVGADPPQPERNETKGRTKRKKAIDLPWNRRFSGNFAETFNVHLRPHPAAGLETPV